MANRPKIAGRNRINQLSRSSRVDNTFLRASDLDDLMSYLDENIRPYKVYSALVSQSGTDEPTVIELENTIGTITISYAGVGTYEITSNGLFTLNKTQVFIGNEASDVSLIFINASSTTDSLFELYTYSVASNGDNTPANGKLSNTSIEIRVYS